MPWFKSYRYRFEFQISNTNVDSALADFPVALFFNSTAGTGSDDVTKVFDTVGADWSKVCVCAASGNTPLWTEVDLWDADNENGVLHVRVPNVSSSAATSVYVYFDADGVGNGFIGDIGSDAGKNVWDDSFVGVYHLSRDATGTQKDSTGNSDATTYNLEADDSENSGGLQGLEFDGTNEYAANTDVAAQSLTSDFHTECYAVSTDNSNREELWNKFDLGNTKGWGINVQWNVGGEFYFGYKKTNTDYHAYASSTYVWSSGSAHYCGFYYKGDGTKPTFYIDGVDRTTDFSVATSGGSGGISGLTDSGIGLQWGRGNTMRGTTYYSTDSLVLETRLSTGERSAAWAKATYYTLADNIGEWQAVESINVAAEGWLADWKYRRKITIPSANVSADLENFPLPLWLSSSAGDSSVDMTAVFDEIGANSHKIAVTDHSGVRQLFVEIDNWDDTAEEAIIHVGVPFVDSAVDTTLYLYYDADKADNDGYVGDPGDAAATNVWDEYFMAVYHFNEAPTAGGKDSTANANDLSHINMDVGDVGDMFPGQGWTMGANELAYDDTLTGAITDYPMTMEVMGIYDGTNVTPQINYCRDVSDSLFLELSMVVATDVARANVYSGSSNAADGTTTISDDAFVYLAGVYENKDSWSVFTNGGDKQTLTSADVAFPAWSDRCLTISGRNDASNDYYEGQVSEARVSSVARSDAWIAATNEGILDSLVQWAAAGDIAAEVGWLRGFGKRSKITIPSTNIDGALDYFPLTLFLSSSCGTGTADMTPVFDEIGANSKKLAVTLADGRTQLPVEIDLWDDTGEEAVLHTRVPSVSSTDTTYLYLYYSADVPDNDEFVGDTGESPAMSVWDDNFKAVYHMGQDPSATTMKDSTASANHLAMSGTMLTGDLVDSAPGKGIDFDGTDDMLYSTTVPVSSYPCTFELKGMCEADGPCLSLADNSVANMQMVLRAVTDTVLKASVLAYNGATVTNAYGTQTLTASTNYYLAGVLRSATERSVFTNGADKQTDTTSCAFATGLDRFSIGGTLDSTPSYYDGDVSEARVSDVARADAWIKATHYSLSDGLLSYNTNIETEDNWLGDWGYRIQCRVDSSLIDSDLTGFPVTLSLNAASGLSSRDVTAIFDELGSNSLKLAVATEAGVQCYVEVELWDSTGETAVLHTQIPSVKSGRDTIFYLYYDSTKSDNSTYVGAPGSTAAQGVWDSDFSAVYHLAEDPTGGTDCIKDSTGNGLHGTPGGSMIAGNLVDGNIGKALDFDNSDDYISVSNDTPLDIGVSDDLTVEAVFNSDVASEMDMLLDNRESGTAGFLLGLHSDNSLHFFVWDGTDNAEPIGNTTLTRDGSVWYYGGGRFDRNGDNDADVWLNAADDVTTPSSASAVGSLAHNTAMRIADNSMASSWGNFGGKIAEIRISKYYRADAWMKATYHTLFDTLVYLGTEEEVGSDWSAAKGWGSRYPFTIPPTNIDASVVGIPITLFLGASVGTGTDDMTPVFDEVGENYKRVMVSAANGKPLPCEVDMWDGAGESAVLHVKVPFVESNYGAQLYLYYNDNQPDQGWTGATGEYIAQRVWDDNFLAVYHFSDDLSGGTLSDSTANGNDGTASNFEAGDTVDGQVGKHITPDGSAEWIDLPAAVVVSGAAQRTVEALAFPDQVGGGYFLYLGSAAAYQNYILIYESTKVAIGFNTVNWGVSGTFDNTLRHIAIWYPDSSTNTANAGMHINGAAQSMSLLAGSHGTVNTGTSYHRLFRNEASSYYSNVTDEVRFSDIQRSSAWLKATYYTLADSLGAWGAEETEPVGGEIEIVFTTTPSMALTPKALTTELSIEMFLSTPAIAFEAPALTASYIGNVLKMVEAEGSRPRAAAATGTRPGIARASGAKPRLAAAEAFAYQEKE